MYILACTCLCVHACMCMCVCMCMHACGAPPYPPTPCPSPELQGSQISKNAIKLEQIKIIQFHLKIWDLCTFLHSYRLGLICRWGGVPSQIAFFTFGPKKYIFLAPVSSQEKFFQFSHWNLIDHV